jgi:murein tripeptide amidase MpaA
MPVTISISDTFDGGNIKFVEQCANRHDNTMDVVLHIQPDVFSELEQIAHMQYFCFRVTLGGLDDNDEEQQVNYIIDNAQETSYPIAWSGTTVFYGSDVEDVDGWKRNLTTHYGDGKLTWQHTHERNGSLYFAYFPPYSYARHLKLISQCTPYAQVGTLGQSLEGREMEYITVGTGSLVCWIIHRQHPGETMAEHYAEGLLHRLLGIPNKGNISGDKIVQQVLEKFTFYIVPCMCPDGAVKGHLRTNACGANLNREWATVKEG